MAKIAVVDSGLRGATPARRAGRRRSAHRSPTGRGRRRLPRSRSFRVGTESWRCALPSLSWFHQVSRTELGFPYSGGRLVRMEQSLTHRRERCSIARSLEVLGQKWSLLIVREAFWGRTRFAEFRAALGVAPDVLTDRLGRLVDARHPRAPPLPRGRRARARGVRAHRRGPRLLPVLAAMSAWGDEYRPSGFGPAARLHRPRRAPAAARLRRRRRRRARRSRRSRSCAVRARSPPDGRQDQVRPTFAATARDTPPRGTARTIRRG